MSNLNLNTNINFFAPKINNARKSSFRKKMLVIIPALLLIALGAFYAYMEYIIHDIEKERNELKQYLSSQEVVKIRKDYNDRKKTSDSLTKYSAILDNIDKNLLLSGTISSSLIQKINGVLPKDTVFKSYTIADKNVQITGETASRITSAELLHNLTSTGLFEEVRIGSLTQATDGAVTNFTLQGTLKEVLAK